MLGTDSIMTLMRDRSQPASPDCTYSRGGWSSGCRAEKPYYYVCTWQV